ncbi:MAG: hypothetical protein ACRC28_18940 [Clostridium sp.]|uniref:hypothetical protein n=1 Tax=Clostridium sp. TaxID=1506 RepID=UPI003F30C805
MEPIIENGVLLNVNDLKGKYAVFNEFKNNFYIKWNEPIDESIVDKLDEEFKTIYVPGCYAVGNYDLKNYPMKDVKMVILRDLVKTDVGIKTYDEFVKAVEVDIISKYGDMVRGLDFIFSKFKEEKGFDINKMFKKYLFQAYKGFFSEYRTKLILASHSKCRDDRVFDVYETDRIGDLYEKIDFLIYVRRNDGNSDGFWKKVGNGSKTTKNETEEKCSVVFHGFKCEKCIHLGYGLYVVKKEDVYRVIEEVLALETI